MNKRRWGANSSNSLQYTRRENDNTGLYFYRARYFDPQLKRFISSDPIGLAGGLNTYSYTYQYLLRYVDPHGTDTFVVNRNIGGNAAEPWWDPFKHTLTFSTNPDGSVSATYSWGNSANPEGWNLNQPEDMAAAADALAKGYAQRVGPSCMDPYYRQAFDQLNNSANEHWNRIITNNCKTETVNLNDRAWKIWSSQ